jgi:uroporphyrin-III C-methyltransferase
MVHFCSKSLDRSLPAHCHSNLERPRSRNSSTIPTMSHISLLTSIDSTGHIHLIIGSNPLAAARCAKSLEVGAKPLLIAPDTVELHYALQKRIDNGEVVWLKKPFEDEDVLRLGREEINGVVDAVFVTSGPRDPLSRELPNILDLS